jgi:hypothetical protein
MEQARQAWQVRRAEGVRQAGESRNRRTLDVPKTSSRGLRLATSEIHEGFVRSRAIGNQQDPVKRTAKSPDSGGETRRGVGTAKWQATARPEHRRGKEPQEGRSRQASNLERRQPAPTSGEVGRKNLRCADMLRLTAVSARTDGEKPQAPGVAAKVGEAGSNPKRSYVGGDIESSA